MVLNTQKTGRNRAHEDQPPVLLEVLERRLPHEELRPRVEIEDVIVLLFRDLFRLVPALGAGVAHDDIDPTKVLLRLLEQPVDLGHLGDVGLEGNGLGPAAAGLNLLDDFVGGGFGRLVVDDDTGTALAELNRAATANAW